MVQLIKISYLSIKHPYIYLYGTFNKYLSFLSQYIMCEIYRTNVIILIPKISAGLETIVESWYQRGGRGHSRQMCQEPKPRVKKCKACARPVMGER